MNRTGTLFYTDTKGSPRVATIALPIETHDAALGWAVDFFRKVNEFSAIRKFVLRMVLGRFAYRELVGLRDSLNTYGYDTTFGYGLEEQEYHKDAVSL